MCEVSKRCLLLWHRRDIPAPATCLCCWEKMASSQQTLDHEINTAETSDKTQTESVNDKEWGVELEGRLREWIFEEINGRIREERGDTYTEKREVKEETRLIR